MRYSTFFPKSNKREFKEDLSKNAVLLTKAGYVNQLMAGSYTLLPLGLRVIGKINNIIREELDKTGAQEMLMPLLHPKEIWDTTGRWSDPEVKKIMYQFEDSRGKNYGLSFTHEEVVMNLIGKYINSYKDLPIKLYQFSTKFRNEPRAKSGVLRAREFIMNDLYSAHESEEDLNKYYEEVKKSYVKIFKRIGFNVKITEAPGGVFTDKYTHEFQFLSDVGEDEIYYCEACDFARNSEIFNEDDDCPNCKKKPIKAKSIEVGNIFPLGTKYSKAQNVQFKDKNGKEKDVWFASYGIGPTRVMGSVVEAFSDDSGIIWPNSISPFQVYLVSLGKDNEASEIEEKLEDAGIEVLFDDREVSAGEKFASADLLGFPYRIVVSEKTLSMDSGQTGKMIEFKKRNNEQAEFLSLDELTTKMQEEMEVLH